MGPPVTPPRRHGGDRGVPQASVLWSISYYASPLAVFYLYRKGEGGRGGAGFGQGPGAGLGEERCGLGGCWGSFRGVKVRRGLVLLRGGP